MKRIILSLAATGAMFAAMPAQAAGTILLPGDSGKLFTSFVADSATQGTQLIATTVPGVAFTFSGLLRTAVYLNTFGTLDFYYQVARTGAGSVNNKGIIDKLTTDDFAGYTVQGYVSAADPDMGGDFTAANNPPEGSNPPGSTTTTGVSPDGVTLRTDFGLNGLSGTQTSATYIFRTNATQYTVGTFGILNGSSYSGLSYAPTGAVPEPASWALMLTGFGIVGSALRRRQRTAAYAV